MSAPFPQHTDELLRILLNAIRVKRHVGLDKDLTVARQLESLEPQ
ncbi:MAG: hypothetical protein AAF645_28325 [Myxococcota bacterium]